MMGPEILGQLLDRHARALTLYARQWCGTPEDVVQEAFVKLATQRPPPERVVPWLYGVVRNMAITAARKEGRRRRHETAAAMRADSWFAAEVGAGLDGTVATGMLLALPAEEREAITLHLWSGLTFDEIGEVTGVSSSTAHRRYASGLDHLRERLNVDVERTS